MIITKKVWLYTTEKNLGIYYCIDDGKYYYKNMGQGNIPLASGVAIIWSIIFMALNGITLDTNIWNMVFIASNILIFLFLRFLRKYEEKKYHPYYPIKDQFIDKLSTIQKTNLKEFIGLMVFGILIVISIFCWIKYSSNKLIWLALELASVIFIYCITIINGMVFKKEVIKLIKAREI